jgi:hypothetical protein
MRRSIIISFLLVISLGITPHIVSKRKAVSGTEVTGTFRSNFKGKARGSYNEILIQALGRNKLKVEMALTYPYRVNGEWTANVGEASGEALIDGDTAIFVPDNLDSASEENKKCKITLNFARPGTLVVTTENNMECGFGLNVYADGTYQKVSGARPKFGQNQ